ncbi:MAG: hypothetical protein RBR35_15770 [Salinivirgaceae bacterium]|nr:hypothetical protein [Salinivirgaceae bacterium]
MLLQSLLEKAEPVGVPVENLEDGSAPVAEYKEMTGEGLCVATHNPSYVANYDMLRNEVMPSELRIGELFADT